MHLSTFTLSFKGLRVTGWKIKTKVNLCTFFFKKKAKNFFKSYDKWVLYLPSLMSLSRISQANIVGFSLLYVSILLTTNGVATFGLDPPMTELWFGGRNSPNIEAWADWAAAAAAVTADVGLRNNEFITLAVGPLPPLVLLEILLPPGEQLLLPFDVCNIPGLRLPEIGEWLLLRWQLLLVLLLVLLLLLPLLFNGLLVLCGWWWWCLICWWFGGCGGGAWGEGWKGCDPGDSDAGGGIDEGGRWGACEGLGGGGNKPPADNKPAAAAAAIESKPNGLRPKEWILQLQLLLYIF